jgi:hypothetical protein|tara:strand:+ start:1405 stop:1584 length:180 start_codon:yes stop_codon:yes gene_type:complete
MVCCDGYTHLDAVGVEQRDSQVIRMLWEALVDWLWYAGIPAVTIMSFGLFVVALIKFIA